MVRAAALGALLLLSACDDLPQAHSKKEIERIAADQNEHLVHQISDLNSRVFELERKLADVDRTQGHMGRAIDGISAELDHTATVVDGNTLKDATRRGDCGKEVVRRDPASQGGGLVLEVRNIPCTTENYFKRKK